jgi:short-subunit dehydrogenase involved in D-alanine esterification of teichoic acids
MKTSGNTILITGGGSGIGEALAHRFHDAGNTVIIAGRRKEALDAAAAGRPDMHAMTLDVESAEGVADFAERVLAAHPSLNVLINNAGIMLPDELGPEALERHLAVNLHGSNAVTEAFLPALVSSRGAVVSLLSCAALAPLPMFASYSISKAAAFSMTKTLRARHAGQGVRFHAVLAGPIDTDMTRELPIPKSSPQSAARAIMDAVDRGEEDIFPDPATAPLAQAWASGADKILERQFAALVPPAAARA